MPLRAAVLVVFLSACGSPDSLSSLNGASLWVSITRTATWVSSVSAGLELTQGQCPTLAASADLNGNPIPLVTEGGRTSGSYYFVPTSNCASPSFWYEASGSDGGIAASGPMALTIKDPTATFELRSDDALVLNIEPVSAASRRAGDRLIFSITRPFDTVDSPALTFRREGEAAHVVNTAYEFPQLQGGQIVSTIPSTGPGRYEWFASVSARVGPSGCSGISVCQPLFLQVSGTGFLTVDP